MELISRAEAIGPEAFQAMYDALVSFVRTEWVEGPCEGDQTCQSACTKVSSVADV